MAGFTPEEMQRRFGTPQANGGSSGFSPEEMQQKFSQQKPKSGSTEAFLNKPVGQASFSPEQNIDMGTQTKDPTFAGGIVRGMTRPFADAAVNIKAIGQLLSGKSKEEATAPIKTGYWGDLEGIGLDGGGGFSKKNLLNSVGHGLEMASNLPVAKGVGVIAGAVKQPFLKTAVRVGKEAGKEAFTGSLLNSTGNQLSNDGGINLIKTGIDTAAGTLAGVGLGVAVPGAMNMGIKGVNLFSKNKINKPLESLRQRAVERASDVFKMTGKKPIKFSLDNPKNNVDGMSVLMETSPFDWKASEDITADTLRSVMDSKDQIFKQFDEIGKQAGNNGARINVGDSFDFLKSSYLNKPGTTSPMKNTAMRLMREVQDSFPDGTATPSEIQYYIKNLGEQTTTPGSEKMSQKVIADFINFNKKQLDDSLDNLGPEYFALRQKYSKIKSVEESLVKLYQKARKADSSGEMMKLADNFANAEMIASIVTANPALFIKTLGLRQGNKWLAKMKDPQNMLKGIYEAIDEMRSHPDYKLDFGEAVTPLGLPAGTPGAPRVKMESGAPISVAPTNTGMESVSAQPMAGSYKPTQRPFNQDSYNRRLEDFMNNEPYIPTSDTIKAGRIPRPKPKDNNLPIIHW